MISCSHWGMFPEVEAMKWAVTAPVSYDSEYLHGYYQHLNFGSRQSKLDGK